MRNCPSTSSAVVFMSTPIRRTGFGCCARATSGDAAVPKRSVMKFRRCMRTVTGYEARKSNHRLRCAASAQRHEWGPGKRLLWAICRHAQPKTAGPLHSCKRTSSAVGVTSAMGHNRTHAPQQTTASFNYLVGRAEQKAVGRSPNDCLVPKLPCRLGISDPTFALVAESRKACSRTYVLLREDTSERQGGDKQRTEDTFHGALLARSTQATVVPDLTAG